MTANERRPGMGTGAASDRAANLKSDPTVVESTGGTCCGALGLAEIAECSRRRIYCSTERCAYQSLLRRQLEQRVDTEWRIAELTVVADLIDNGSTNYAGAWIAAQLRDLRDLLQAGDDR